MDEHQIERTAAAFNQLRPDWPVRSLRTFLARPELEARPYRDVVVALGWVACEPGTASPARVLEAGPWWRAANTDGSVPNIPDRLDRSERCGICGKPRERCEATERRLAMTLPAEAHDFRPDFRADRARAALRAAVAPHTDTQEDA